MKQERAFFFTRSNGARLFGILHPALSSDSARTAETVVIYCNPIFEEHLCSHRISVNFARRAAQNGITILRFDYYGDGESDGLFEDASVSSRVYDILDAVTYVNDTLQPARIILLGLRVGATLALLAAQQAPLITGILCWAPVMNLNDYLYTMLRSNLTTQMALYKKIIHNRDALVEQILTGNTVNVDGYEIGKPLYQEAMDIDLTKERSNANCPIHIMQVSASLKLELPLKNYLEKNNGLSIDSTIVKEEKFWLPLATVYPACEELFSKSIEWVQQCNTSG